MTYVNTELSRRRPTAASCEKLQRLRRNRSQQIDQTRALPVVVIEKFGSMRCGTPPLDSTWDAALNGSRNRRILTLIKRSCA